MAREHTLVWFRTDLRTGDNPALSAAAARGVVIPVFIWAPEEELPWEPGAASRVWLHGSLAALDASLQDLGLRLILRDGPTIDALDQLIEETGATGVVWNRRHEPAVVRRDALVEEHLHKRGLHAESHSGSLLFEPTDIATKQGGPYQVFTPFWKACCGAGPPPPPRPVPRDMTGPDRWPESLPLEALRLLPEIDWVGGIREAWEPGEAGAHARLDHLAEVLPVYADQRDRPDREATSRLSPHLHFGEVSPGQVWHAAMDAAGGRHGKGVERFLAELGWREFAHHLIHHFPHTTDAPLRAAFGKFPWRDDPEALGAWQRGRTGFPLVDAGMRELWATGWMHNRVRMIVASFLTKDLLIPWQAGARWFWDTLVDADLASNTLGWQWTAGCGADAAPYFRVFNPVGQGQKFDPDGAYTARWVPERAALTAGDVHLPEVAAEGYPPPMVDHSEARLRALEAYETIKGGA
jgi:deoxyribodipyrimidine photo-lyase